MSNVIVDISMSLDGYITTSGVDQEHGLGIDGEAIHAWVLEELRFPGRRSGAGGQLRTDRRRGARAATVRHCGRDCAAALGSHAHPIWPVMG
jgi:hypothetical protein